MSYISWANKKIKNLKACDIAFIKLAMIAFALFIAKLIPGILGLEWYWYLIFFIILIIKPIIQMFKK